MKELEEDLSEIIKYVITQAEQHKEDSSILTSKEEWTESLLAAKSKALSLLQNRLDDTSP
jgi:hypothetical protein